MQQQLVPNKVFVGGVPRSGTEDDLAKAAQVFGKVRCVKLIRSLTKSTANFGFVSFWHDEAAQRMIAAKVKIRSKIVDCKPTRHYDSLKEANEELLRHKIYIGGFCKQLTETDVACLFETFGKIKEVSINRDLLTNRSRGSGFVVFESEDICQQVTNMRITELEGQRMIVLPCKRRGQISKLLHTNSGDLTAQPQSSSDLNKSSKTTPKAKLSSFKPTRTENLRLTSSSSCKSSQTAGCKVFVTANQHKRQVAINHCPENVRFNHPSINVRR